MSAIESVILLFFKIIVTLFIDRRHNKEFVN